MADARRSRRRLRRIAPLVALVVIAAAGSAAYAATTGGGPSYVTGLVTRGDIQQTLDLTGSVAQVNSVSAAFRVFGTVTSVSVIMGQHVTAGQELARIDAAPLQTALLEAQATLAQASATLQSDESGTSSTATTSAAMTGMTPTATLTAFTPSGSSGAGRDLQSLEKAVTAAQAQAASSQAAVDSALLAAITACATSSSPTPSPSASSTPSGATTPTPSSSASGHTATPAGTSCADALAAVQRAVTAEAAATKALGAAVDRLAAAAAAGQSAGGNSGNNGSSPGNGGSATGATSGGTRSGGNLTGGQNSSAGAGSTNSASRIASDQAAVTTAQAAVSDAQRNLDAAILRSPTAGSVASVGLTKGAAASTSSSITIVSQGAARVTIDVPLASMPSVKVGQTAYVTPNGATTAEKGAVSSIGLLPASGSTSTASYPVTVLVPASDLMQMPTGSSAQVSLVMSTVHNAITVPNSALTRLGTGGNTAFVTVLKDGTATRTRVTTGAVGTLATAVTSGVTVGQTIVLADRSAALPANSSTSTRVFSPDGGGFAGFGGSGGPGGFGGVSRFSGRTG